MKRIPILFIISVFILVGCKNKNGHIPTVTDRTTVSEYSPIVLSVKEEFFVRFSKKYISESEVNSEVSSDLFTVEPSVDGKAIWEDRRTIVFKPSKQWDYNTNYKVFVDTDKMFGSGKRSMITFKTSPLQASVYASPMQIKRISGKRNIVIEGMVTMTDYANNELVESLVDVFQKGNNDLKIEWQHQASNFIHSFIISNVMRFDLDSVVEIKTKANKPVFKINEKFFVDIPSKEKFNFIGVSTPKDGEKYFELSFSDPVDRNQNLDGLIRIKDSSSSLKFDIKQNIIKVYPSPFPLKNVTISISSNVQSSASKKLDKEINTNLEVVPIKPELRFVSSGNILPHAKSAVIAFEARALNMVDIEIFKIYENNVQEYFQNFTLKGSGSYRTVGEVVHTEQLVLNPVESIGTEEGWSRYAIDLDYFSSADPASIYEVRLGFKKEYSSYDSCQNEIDESLISYDLDADMFSRYYNYPGISWEHYSDPCYPAYYGSTNFKRKNVLVSNLGLVAKATDGKGINIYASDLRNAQSLSGVTINFYTQSKQLITSLLTDKNGMAYLEDGDDVFFVTGRNDREYAYLTIMNNRKLETSQFDVTGVNYEKGINGFMYGERGVWRPGDTIFLSLMVEDREAILPNDHPVKLNVYNARGVLHKSITKLDNVDGLYVFPIETSQMDPTGNWRAEAKVGNHVFRKQLKVETVKPNRLKIMLDRANDSLYNVATEKIKIESKWLHGAPSSGLKAKVEANYISVEPKFEKFPEFSFNDPARKINTNNQVVYEGKLDENGIGAFYFNLTKNENFPGNIKVNLNTRVFEKSGNFSDYFSSNVIFPYKSYAGVKLPKSRWGRNYISSQTGTKLNFVSIGGNGKPNANRKLKVGIYESRWSWWYNRSDRNIYKYNSDNHFGAIDTFTVVTNSKGEAIYDSNFGDSYGNYMIRVCDELSGHCSGEFFYTGRWGASVEEENSMTKLNIKKNATKYEVGDEVTVNFPSSENSNILVTIESVNGVLSSEWIPSQGMQTEYKFRATEEMLPNIYINVNMIQTWERSNDLPIRMYGILPIKINDPSTELNPVINCDDVFSPNSKVEVMVSEKDGKGMAYTIAMVDEGLLDLTNFRIPKPHKHFYAKQALNVRTWDMFDDVMNKNGGDIEKIISIGGDGESLEEASKANVNRFVPVVYFDGPFNLEKGETKTHQIEIPNYMGSVKLMVVSKHKNAYGSTEKVIAVKDELMLMTTYPRVLTLGDQFSIPINTFWTENRPMDVSLRMETNDKVKATRSTSIEKFDNQGDKISNMFATVGDSEGVAEFRIYGEAGKFDSYDEVEIEVRNPNPLETRIKDYALTGGESLSDVVNRFGVLGNQSATLEISRMPSLNLEKRLNYLIRYPYGCLEQTVSSAFPQLYIADLTELSDLKEKELTRNIAAAISKLKSFQRSGRFNYWRGGNYYHNWSDVYAAHFLFEAEQKGFFVGSNVLKSWLSHHQEIANQFDSSNSSLWSHDVQAYRLYVLAKMGQANTGAMNRLRGSKKLNSRARYLLAAAYGVIGQASVGERVLVADENEFSNDDYDYYSFSSVIRDQAIAALAISEMGDNGNALKFVQSIAEKLRSSNWYSTHSIAFGLMAVAKITENGESEIIDYSISVNGGAERHIQSEKVLNLYDLKLVEQSSFNLTNHGKNVIYVSVNNSGKEKPSIIAARNDNLKIEVEYYDESGNEIEYKMLKQGTDFVARVTVRNPGTADSQIDDLALSQVFPAGWEIRTGGLSNSSRVENYQYQEVRDDRVNTFFKLNTRKKKVFEVKLSATYVGDYYMPPVTCESMYNNRIYASTGSNRVKVIE